MGIGLKRNRWKIFENVCNQSSGSDKIVFFLLFFDVFLSTASAAVKQNTISAPL
jgi:hypothetical protein